MPKDYPPPSKPERESLVRERSKDHPRPIPQPKPPGIIGAAIDDLAAKRRADAAHEREHRIISIDHALEAKRGLAKSEHRKVKASGFAKAHAATITRSKPREKVR